MKNEREADQQRLNSLIRTRDNITKLIDTESNLKDLCTRIVRDLDNCTNKDKRDAYIYLYLEIKATLEGADIKGYVQPKLLTIAQTSGCLISCVYEWPSGKKSVNILQLRSDFHQRIGCRYGDV
jgi:site-specific DNA recombinase